MLIILISINSANAENSNDINLIDSNNSIMLKSDSVSNLNSDYMSNLGSDSNLDSNLDFNLNEYGSKIVLDSSNSILNSNKSSNSKTILKDSDSNINSNYDFNSTNSSNSTEESIRIASKELYNRIINAKENEIILIGPGIYKIHNVNITKNITLQGNANPREVIIDGENLSSIFLISNISIYANFYNLTIMNGLTDNFGGGICIETGNIEVNNCIFINNTALNNTNGGAISNYGNETNRSFALINNTLFIGNHADHDGGAVTTCYAISNIYNSVFINNSAHRDGGAIRVSVFGYGAVQDCIFIDNYADEWAGAYYSWAGNSSIDRCIFVNNTAGTNGGAVMVSGSLNLTNSLIVNNTGGETGGSFYIQQPMFDAVTKINVYNNIITNNSSPLGKEIYVKWNATDLLFPNFNSNYWGDEDPTDPDIVDPDNVSNRIHPSQKKVFAPNLDLNWGLLEGYSDIIDAYYNRNNYDNDNNNNNNGNSNNNNHASNDNSGTGNNNSNFYTRNATNALNNNSNGNGLSNIFNSSSNFNSSSGSSKNNESTNFVSEYSKNPKMVELIEDNPSSQKSADIRYLVVFVIVVLTFFVGLSHRRNRNN